MLRRKLRSIARILKLKLQELSASTRARGRRRRTGTNVAQTTCLPSILAGASKSSAWTRSAELNAA
jgi:hypothetical protein